MEKTTKVNGRFFVTKEDGWQTVDSLDGSVISHETRKQAEECARFARLYVKAHGDIDFASFPYSLLSPLHYDEWEGRNRIHVEDKAIAKRIAMEIEECPIVMRHLNEYGFYSLPTHKKQEYIDAGIVSPSYCAFFESVPNGETDLYKWETRKVDELRNLWIFKK